MPVFMYRELICWENSKIKDGWDPEASRKVETFGRYPFTRNLTVGLNLTF